MLNAVGVNTGPGTFLIGAMKHFDIRTSLNTTSLGLNTCLDNALPFTVASKDYTSWPSWPNTHAVFANAEDWLSVSSAAYYTIMCKAPIGIIDLRSSFSLQYDSFLAELAERCFEKGYRVCYLTYHTASFNTGIGEGRFCFVLYDKRKNFNVTAPKLPQIIDNLYDRITDFTLEKAEPAEEGLDSYLPNNYHPLNYEESLCAPKIPRGQSLRGTFKYQRHLLPGGCYTFLRTIQDDTEYRDIQKLSWSIYLPTSNIAKFRFLHPEYDRLLTISEFMKICRWPKAPKGPLPIEQILYGTSVPAGEWLAYQAYLYLQNNWKEKDYQLEYKKKEKKFHGSNANPLRPKKFINLLDYRNTVFRKNKDEIDKIIHRQKVREKGEQFILL